MSKKQTMQQAAELLLNMPVQDPSVAAKLRSFGIPEDEITNQMVVLVAMMNQASKGNVKAAAFLRDVSGTEESQSISRVRSRTQKNQTLARRIRDSMEEPSQWELS